MEIDLERYRPLMMGLMDGELTPEEAAEVNQALNRSAVLREEYKKLREATGRLECISMLEPADEVARELWNSPYHRLARDGGIWMILGGYVLLLAYGIFEFINSDARGIPRIGAAGIALGTVMLLVTFIRERQRTHAVDPYKEIER